MRMRHPFSGQAVRVWEKHAGEDASEKEEEDGEEGRVGKEQEGFMMTSQERLLLQRDSSWSPSLLLLHRPARPTSASSSMKPPWPP
jgi:hypothetical protein